MISRIGVPVDRPTRRRPRGWRYRRCRNHPDDRSVSDRTASSDMRPAPRAASRMHWFGTGHPDVGAHRFTDLHSRPRQVAGSISGTHCRGWSSENIDVQDSTRTCSAAISMASIARARQPSACDIPEACSAPSSLRCSIEGDLPIATSMLQRRLITALCQGCMPSCVRPSSAAGPLSADGGSEHLCGCEAQTASRGPRVQRAGTSSPGGGARRCAREHLPGVRPGIDRAARGLTRPQDAARLLIHQVAPAGTLPPNACRSPPRWRRQSGRGWQAFAASARRGRAPAPRSRHGYPPANRAIPALGGARRRRRQGSLCHSLQSPTPAKPNSPSASSIGRTRSTIT